jgi:hypothetical protein
MLGAIQMVGKVCLMMNHREFKAVDRNLGCAVYPQLNQVISAYNDLDRPSILRRVLDVVFFMV